MHSDNKDPGLTPQIWLIGPWEMWLYYQISNFQTFINYRYLEPFQWNCPQVNAARPHWWLVKTGPGDIQGPPLLTLKVFGRKHGCDTNDFLHTMTPIRFHTKMCNYHGNDFVMVSNSQKGWTIARFSLKLFSGETLYCNSRSSPDVGYNTIVYKKRVSHMMIDWSSLLSHFWFSIIKYNIW